MNSFEQRHDGLKAGYRNGEFGCCRQDRREVRRPVGFLLFFQEGSTEDFNWNDDCGNGKGVVVEVRPMKG